MQDENVPCRDLGKESFERAVECFGTSQLERATHFHSVSNQSWKPGCDQDLRSQILEKLQ